MPSFYNIHGAGKIVAGDGRQVSVRYGNSPDERVLNSMSKNNCGNSVENVENSTVVEVEDIYGGVDVNGAKQDVSVH